MAKTHTVLEVFIASPGDVAPERKVLESVVSEFNLTWGDKHQVHLELIKWETHSRPAFGEDAQDVINNQIGDRYDIFLGIMWGRFGTATTRSESGTEEEFNRAYNRLKNGDQVEIMFYFKDAGISPSKLDSEQISKVQKFKKKISDEYGGLYHEFEILDDFQTKARIHLSKVVQDWLNANTGAIKSKTVQEKVEQKAEEYNPLANLAALDDRDADEGVIDLMDQGTEAMDEVLQIVTRMTSAITDLGEKFNQRTKEAEAISDKTDRKLAKRVANNAANDIDIFVKRMSAEIPEFYNQNAIFAESFSKMALIADRDFDKDANNIDIDPDIMKEYRIAIDTSSSSLVEFKQTIAILPRMTTVFNQARRRAVAIMDDLLDQLRVVSSQT